jgi:hypothetical protein
LSWLVGKTRNNYNYDSFKAKGRCRDSRIAMLNWAIGQLKKERDRMIF